MHSQGSVYIVHICIHTVEPICNPRTKDTTSLNRTHFPPKCVHFQLLNTSLTFCPIGGDVPLYLYNTLVSLSAISLSVAVTMYVICFLVIYNVLMLKYTSRQAQRTLPWQCIFYPSLLSLFSFSLSRKRFALSDGLLHQICQKT